MSSNDSASIASLNQVKLEPQILADTNLQHEQIDAKFDDNSQLFMQLGHTQFDHISQTSNQLHQILPSQQNNESTNEYDLAEKVLFNFNDISALSNGPEKLISSESIHDNLGIISNNEPSLSTFDTL